MQLEHEHQPPGSTVPACSPAQPIPALAAGPHHWGCYSHSYWRGQAHREVAGNGAAGLSLWDPSSLSTMLLVSGTQGLTHSFPVSRIPVLGRSQTGAA